MQLNARRQLAKCHIGIRPQSSEPRRRDGKEQRNSSKHDDVKKNHCTGSILNGKAPVDVFGILPTVGNSIVPIFQKIGFSEGVNLNVLISVDSTSSDTFDGEEVSDLHERYRMGHTYLQLGKLEPTVTQ